MSLQTFKVRLIIKANKLNQKGLAPIFAKVRLNSLKIEISTQRNISPNHWSSAKESAYPLNPINKAFNQYLESFRNKIYNGYTLLLSTGEMIDRDNLIKAIFGTEPKKRHYFLEVVKEHNEQFAKHVGNKYSAGSYKNYKTTSKYLNDFVPQHYGHKPLPLEKVDYQFCDAYYNFLLSEKTCTNNGAAKQIQRIKTIINYAVKRGYITANNTNSYSLKLNPVHKVALTMQEINKIANLLLTRDTLCKVRDCYIFQCYTGLAYSDLKRLVTKNIERGDEGELWIRMKRQKTQLSFSVPLLPAALAILKKYENEDSPFLFPVLSNQKMNENLKVIQEIAGISKNLTTHLARHSFATTITLNNNVPIETVSRMLGHTNIRTTQIYAKVLDAKIKNDMNDLKNKLER